MNKTLLIIKREYLSRVTKKTFLVTTILLPLLVSGLIALISYLAVKSEEKQLILVNDLSGFFINQLDSTNETYQFTYDHPLPKENNQDFLNRLNADILVSIYPFTHQKPDSVLVFKKGGVSLAAKTFINSELDDIFQVKLMQDAGINKVKIDSIQQSAIDIKSYDLDNNKETSSEIATAIGYIMGFLMYIIIFIYGSGVMRGVMEEKTNRIAEVIVSSVKPFQLMMGKIIGIGLVGLTQFLIWALLMVLVSIIVPMFFPALQDTLHGPVMNDPMIQQQAMQEIQNDKLGIIQTLYNQNWALIIGAFIFYFLGGYFMYAALFAAVGSLVNEDPQEAQQLTLPVSMPIIFSIIILQSTIRDPNSSLSVFGSMFPLSSPIIMLGRIPYGVPVWQLLTSMFLLIVGFVAMTWISGKIYRTGILMYGKKISLKEAIKWLTIKS